MDDVVMGDEIIGEEDESFDDIEPGVDDDAGADDDDPELDEEV